MEAVRDKNVNRMRTESHDEQVRYAKGTTRRSVEGFRQLAAWQIPKQTRLAVVVRWTGPGYL